MAEDAATVDLSVLPASVEPMVIAMKESNFAKLQNSVALMVAERSDVKLGI